jgi:hypothetical protein
VREALELQGPRNVRAHTAVGAYALGLLDPDGTWAFEDHLVGCRHCADELESLVRVVAALGRVESPASVRQAAAEPADPVGDTRADAGPPAPRPPHRRPSVVQLLLSGVVMVGVLLTTGSLARTGAAGPDRPPQFAPAVGQERQLSATDPVTRVHAEVGLTVSPGGTRVALTVANIDGPMDCRLVAEGTRGQSQVLSSWHVPSGGFGTAARPDPLRMSASTTLATASIRRFVVQSVDRAGTASALVVADVGSLTGAQARASVSGSPRS